MFDQGKQFGTMAAVDYQPMGGFAPSPVPWVNLNHRPSGSKGMGPQTILVVDDDASVPRLTATILKINGYGVIEADCGLEGLGRFAEHQSDVDLVLSDVVMPHMTGLEMVEKIHALDPSALVMLMSGCSIGLKVEEAIPVLPKPFTPTALLQAIRARLDSHAAALNMI
jgi:CheY-like chemotaxis protein